METASYTNISVLQRFQNKVLRDISDAPYYIDNEIIQHDIPLEFIKEAIHSFSVNYCERVKDGFCLLSIQRDAQLHNRWTAVSALQAPSAELACTLLKRKRASPSI